jgi:5-methylcytosine-specific restriction endonuclease McrA
MADSRSPQAQVYRRWYWTPQWRATSKAQLKLEPLCRMCDAVGRVTPATVCDHIQDHKGDAALFWDRSNHQSLCKPCHDGPKRTGRMGIGVDGWPV